VIELTLQAMAEPVIYIKRGHNRAVIEL